MQIHQSNLRSSIDDDGTINDCNLNEFNKIKKKDNENNDNETGKNKWYNNNRSYFT